MVRHDRFRAGSLLLLLILLPVAGLAGVAGSAGAHRWDERRTAVLVQDETARMDALMTARTAVIAESAASMALVMGAEDEVSAATLVDLYGVDYPRRLGEARAAVDADELLQTEFALSADLRHLLAARPAVDAGNVSSSEIGHRFEAMSEALNELWLEARRRLDRTIAAGSISGAVRERVEMLNASYDALLAGGERVRLVNELLSAAGDASIRDLIEVEGRLDAAVRAFRVQLGTDVEATFASFRANAAVLRFDRVVEELVEDGLAAGGSPLAVRGAQFGTALADGVLWTDAMTRLVAASSHELGASAGDNAADATSAFWRIVGAAAVVSVLSLVGAAFVARMLRHPRVHMAHALEGDEVASELGERS